MTGPGFRVLAVVSMAVLFAIACDDDAPSTAPPRGGEPIPDFALQDVNPTSPTFEEDVSPRQQLSRISAWYFGSAT